MTTVCQQHQLIVAITPFQCLIQDSRCFHLAVTFDPLKYIIYLKKIT